jgi:hypothetical protein
MSTTTNTGAATAGSRTGTVPMRLEVTALPVADVDRAKAFYESLGWRLDLYITHAKNGVRFSQLERQPAPNEIRRKRTNVPRGGERRLD